MIRISHLTKRFKNSKALDDVSLELPRFGLIFISGPSGCGKTTLLNALAGLTSYKGSVCVESKLIENMDDDSLSSFRLKNYGFIFQDFKLYENETVKQNIMLPIETISNEKEVKKNRRYKDLLNLVYLPGYSKRVVNKLSGGEKQRVAIARALINEPKIILADEPTGALDYKNAQQIMTILEKISSSSLVIVVSHDYELAKNYADEIITMKDGKIENIEYRIHHKKDTYLPLLKNKVTNKIPSIPSNFLLKHTLSTIKSRKGRTMICSSVTSLGLIGVGLAITLSTTISNNIKQAYSELMDESSIMVSIKDQNKSIFGQYAGSYYEAMSLKNDYKEYVDDIGVCYYANFEDYFKDCNCIALQSTSRYCPIDGISVRHINEFQWLDLNTNAIYPSEVSTLEDDEVVFGLTIAMIKDICFNLQIERSITSLSDYISQNDLYVYFDLANNDWTYSDQQIVHVKGFTLETKPTIYHSNHLWNEYMFETRMRFPTSDSLSTTDYYPWVMKKIYYLQTNLNTDIFLEKIRYDATYESYLFEIANSTYFPWLYDSVDVKDIHRVMFFANTLQSIPTRYLEHFLSLSDNIGSPILGNNGGYSIFPSSLMMGFSRFMYFSTSIESLEETLDINSSVSIETNESYELPDDVLVGHYSKRMQDGVSFHVFNGGLMTGRAPENLDEIAISYNMYERLKDEKGFGEYLYVGATVKEFTNSIGKTYKDFKVIPLKVTGVVKDSRPLIYHNQNWTKAFFQSRVGISAFDLENTTISFSIKDNNKVNETIATLQRAFPYYSIVNPLSDLNSSVDEICGYVRIALIAFSSIATIISIFLLSICNYLHVLESKKDIALARCIGITKKESKKFLYSHSLIMCLMSFIMASIELVFINVFVSFTISDTMSSQINLSFDPLSLVLMFALAAFISLICSFLLGNKVAKLDPLEGLKN